MSRKAVGGPPVGVGEGVGLGVGVGLGIGTGLGVGVSVDQMVKAYNAVVLAGFTNIQFVRSR